jgi:pilus assembly protein CpaF
MFFLSKSETETVDAPLASVTYKVGRKQQQILLGPGRHLVGNSNFCKVRIPLETADIVAAILVTNDQLEVKALTLNPAVIVDGKKMTVGQSISVGDIFEFTAGSTTIVITASAGISLQSKGAKIESNESKNKKIKESANPTQTEAELAFSDIDSLRQLLARKLMDQMNQEDDVELQKVASPEVKMRAKLKLRKIIAELAIPDDFSLSKSALETQVYYEVMGYGPLEPLLDDPEVTEIMVNRRDQIFVERAGKLSLAKESFSSDQALLNVIERIVSSVGRRIDTSSPIVDARLLDGSRVNAIIPPLALNGPCLTIRRFSKTPVSINKLVKWDSMTAEMAAFLEVCVFERKNLMISGGTGSGKTTLLNALSSFIPGGERLITVEDAAELQLQQQHVIRMETRPANLEGVGAVSIRDLVKNTLRMRPDRIIVGECRGAEALDMLQAMNTGHDGSMTTAHANAPEDMLRRLETMVMMAGMDLPLRAIREQIVSALTIIVQQSRRKTGRRLVTEIAWIRGLDRETAQYDVVPLVSRAKDETPIYHMNTIKEFKKIEELPDELLDIFEPLKKKGKTT